MLVKNFHDLPEELQCEEVRPYFEILNQRRTSLLCKSIFDRVMAAGMLITLSPVFLVLAIMIKRDSEGEVFFRQTRVTQYGRTFGIYKFRTMVKNAESLGAQVTSQNDMRVTKVGNMLRSRRLDELPQLINILLGDMSFVGTRPEVPRYVAAYTDEMKATLLLPAGVTSVASIAYKDEDQLLQNAQNVDEVYINEVLPGKMAWNLKSIKEFSFLQDIKTMIDTVLAVLR